MKRPWAVSGAVVEGVELGDPLAKEVPVTLLAIPVPSPGGSFPPVLLGFVLGLQVEVSRDWVPCLWVG